MSPTALILLGAAGILAGFVNTLAGGGSLLTLPLLIAGGLDAGVANGTNRLAILMQTGWASWQFRRRGWLTGAHLAGIVVAATAGAILGAMIAAELPEAVMRRVVAVVLLLAFPTVLISSHRQPRSQPLSRVGWIIAWSALFACGVYGGFIQAGIGFALLTVLIAGFGQNLLIANGTKNVLVAIYTCFALAIFAAHGQVRIVPGLALGAGNMLGAQLATRTAELGGVVVVKWIVAGAIVAAGLRLLLA